MEKPKLKGEKVCYVGSDTNFFHNILQRIKETYPQKSWAFSNVKGDGEDQFEQLFIQVLEILPCMIYIDFSEEKEKMLFLAEALSRDPIFSQVPLIGLVDKKEETIQCLGAGLDFLYVKGGEFHDLVYSAMTLAFPKVVKKPQFAKGEINEEVNLYDDFRVGYIAPTYIHVEGNFDLKEGSKVFFKNEIPLSNIPSQKFIVKNRSCSNLYYDFNYSYDLDFVFVDNDLEGKSDDELVDEESLKGFEGEAREERRAQLLKEVKEEQKHAKEDYETNLKNSQKKHKEWLLDKVEGSAEKKTKLLIVDRHMRVFRENNGVDLTNSPYSSHYQTSFSDSFIEVDRQRPSIIAYQLMGEIHPDDEALFHLALERSKLISQEKDFSKHKDAKKEKEIDILSKEIPEKESKELSFIKSLVDYIKGVENYNPILVLFRCYFKSSKALQESLQYPMIVTHHESLSLEVCLNLAKIFEARQKEKFEELIKAKVKNLKDKDPKKYRNLSESDFKENKYFIKKSNKLSYGSIKTPVILNNISESEVTFRSDIELPMKTYRLDFPLALSLHLVPIEEGKDFLKDKDTYIYKGIVHSISETDKKELRHKVNEAIFKPINEKREKEQNAFKELNERVQGDREERDKKEKKEREKSAKEDLGLD